MMNQMEEGGRRGSVSLAEIDSELAESLEEKKFLLAAERGDIISVRKEILRFKKDQHININCTDPLNRSALVIAIENEDSDLLFLLLNGGVRPKDSLLHAIDEEYVEAVEILLEHEEELHSKHPELTAYSWENIRPELATWTSDITPLILAAQKDNYEILKILLDRGAAVPLPHDIKCGCDDCVTAHHEDSLKYSQSRINAYTALTSPSLISLSSRDPILTAFELSWELRKLARIENEFKSEYTELRDKVQSYAVDLLDHARTSAELDIMLNFDPDKHFEEEEEEDEMERKMGLERLKLAVDCRQKRFVSHPHVQQLLGSLWYAGMVGFRRKSMIGQFITALQMAASFPIYSMAYIVAPNSKIGKTAKLPFTKFLTHSAAYMFFLFLLVLASQRFEAMAIKLFAPQWMVERQLLAEQMERGSLPTYTELLIMWYVTCNIWGEIKQLWDAGIRDYAKDLWNFVEFSSNALYVAWIGLRACAWYVVQWELSRGMIAHTPREEWHAFDPMLLSEAMFGAASIFSFLKLVHIFLISPDLGPLQISLGRMVFDIMKFFFFYTLVLFAYACGLNQMLSYYADIDKHKCYSLEDPYEMNRDDAELSCDIWRRFANLFETAQSLFWASFGLVDLNSFELSGQKEFTRFWTLLMFGCYSIMNVVVLLNLLIAMMNHSFSIIAERADVEWKFARTKLWMKYFEDGGTVPPPFNTIPSMKSIKKLFCSKSQGLRHSVRALTIKQRVSEYQKIMRCLVRRYITSKQKRQDQKGVTEDDVNEIKNEINSFRYSLVDMLLKNGFKGEAPEIGGTVQGKKQQQKERMLMKGFNIEVVEGASEVGDHLRGSRKKKDVLAKLVMKATGKSVKKDWNKISSTRRTQSRDQIGNTDRYVRRRTSIKRGTREQSSITKEHISEISRQKSKIRKRQERIQHDMEEYKDASGWVRVAKMTRKGYFSRASVRSDIRENRGVMMTKEEVARQLTRWEVLAEMTRTGMFKDYSDGEEKVVESKVRQYGRGEAMPSLISPSPTATPQPVDQKQDTPPERGPLPNINEDTMISIPDDVVLLPDRPVSPEILVTDPYGSPRKDSPAPTKGLASPKKEPTSPKKDPASPKKESASPIHSQSPVPVRQPSPDLDADLLSFSPLPKINPVYVKAEVKATPTYTATVQKAPTYGRSESPTHERAPSPNGKKGRQSPTNVIQSQPNQVSAPVGSVGNARRFFESQGKQVYGAADLKSSVSPNKNDLVEARERILGKSPDRNWAELDAKSYKDTYSSCSSGTGHFVELPKTNPVTGGSGSILPAHLDGDDCHWKNQHKNARPQVIKIKKNSAQPINYQEWKPPEPLLKREEDAKASVEPTGEETVIQHGAKEPIKKSPSPSEVQDQGKKEEEEEAPKETAAEEAAPKETAAEEAAPKAKQSIKKHRAPSPPKVETPIEIEEVKTLKADKRSHHHSSSPLVPTPTPTPTGWI